MLKNSFGLWNALQRILIDILVLASLARVSVAATASTINQTSTQKPIGIELVAGLGGAVEAVVVSSNYAYIGQGTNITVLDITSPSPTSVFQLDLQNVVSDLSLVGNLLYVMDYDGVLHVVDISTPHSPTIQSNYHTGGRGQGLYAEANTVYLTVYNGGIHIIDVSDPQHPQLLSQYDTEGQAVDIFVSNELAYVADGNNGLHIVDVTNAAAPLFVGSYDTPGYTVGVEVVNERAYVADGHEGLQIIDVSDPSAPAFRGNHKVFFTQDVKVIGDFAYTANSFVGGLEILNVSDPTAPSLVGSCGTRGEAMGITVVNDNAYVADGSSGFQVFDVSDVTNPSHIGGYDVVGSPWGVDVDGHFAYLANYESGLYIVDISEPFTPTMRGDYNTWGESFDLDVVNDIAYVADDGGLSVIDVADKDNPVFLDRHNIGYGDTNKVHVVGNLAYAASKNAGLHILDISSPTSVNSVGSYTDTFASDVAVVGNIAYVADMYDGLKVVDVTRVYPFGTDRLQARAPQGRILAFPPLPNQGEARAKAPYNSFQVA